MSGFFDRILGRNRESSASKAKERLQFVLVHDRINLPPERLKAMKEEILAVISKYVAVSSDEVDIALEQRDRNNNMLIAEIPFSKSLEDAEPTEASEAIIGNAVAENEVSEQPDDQPIEDTDQSGVDGENDKDMDDKNK